MPLILQGNGHTDTVPAGRTIPSTLEFIDGLKVIIRELRGL
ncbi:hypothetical protein [Streptomyces puniciscabiei]|nr:hypothetical protein [Streptomyces puniciscabiei]